MCQNIKLLVADRAKDTVGDLVWIESVLRHAFCEFSANFIVKRAWFGSTGALGKCSRSSPRCFGQARKDARRTEHRDLQLGANLLQFEIQGLRQRDDRMLGDLKNAAAGIRGESRERGSGHDMAINV